VSADPDGPIEVAGSDDGFVGSPDPDGPQPDGAVVGGLAVSQEPGESRPAAGRAARLLRPRGGRRMRHPGGRRHYRALAVADVDLDSSSVTLHEPLSPVDGRVEGVHALVWWHGEPVGELTVPGDPATIRRTLPAVAMRELGESVLEHLLRDALATPGGVPKASAGGLAGLGHPGRAPRDGADLTVAVCTRDRPEDLRRCLTAIAALETPPADVLVVDNASRDDATRVVAAEFGVRYVREPRAGLDWARNRALLEARTRIVAFTDDDVLVHPGWVSGLLRAFDEEPDAVAVTGLVAPAELATPAQVMFEALGGFGRGYARQWMSVAVDAGEVAGQFYPGTGGAGTGANMAVLREPLLALGGFDPALDVGTRTGGGGDLEMYFRVLASGGLVLYEPTAVVRHVHRRTMPELVRQVRGNGTGCYSIWAGAGLRYGRVQARALMLFALRWARRHHVKGLLRSALWPSMWPWALAAADTAGMVGAVVHRYYAQARRAADQQAVAHPDEPQAPPVVRPRASRRDRRYRRTADPLLTVDLHRDGAADEVALPAAEWRRARRARIRVERDGLPVADLSLRIGGSAPSPARLRWEIARRLGPAVVVPGTGWTDLWVDVATAAERGPTELIDALDLRTAAVRPAPQRAVSVLLVTADPAAALRSGTTLPTIAGDAELVVVDTSVDGAVATAFEERTADVHVLRRPGLSTARARNAALESLDGDVVVLVGDDVMPAQGWLDALLRPLADASVHAVTGNVLPARPDDLGAQLLDDRGALGGGPHSLRYGPEWLTRSRGPARTWCIGSTDNAAVRRDVLAAVGGFDENMGSAGDADLFYRILRAGGSVHYEATAVALRRPAEAGSLREAVSDSSAEHVRYHLEVLTRYRDPRGLARLAVGLPRQYLRRASWLVRIRDDYPGDLLAAEVGGYVAGFSRWLRRSGRTS
jgi:GT2 family glycosyltransferase